MQTMLVRIAARGRGGVRKVQRTWLMLVGRLATVACCGDNGAVLMPCGRCRQLLFENGGDSLLVDIPDEPLPIRMLLPYAFGPADIPD